MHPESRTRLTALATALALALTFASAGAAEKPPLDAVRAELSPDGQLYTLIDLEAGWTRVGAELDKALEGVTEEPLHFAKLFETLGLTGIRALGMSSKAVPGGYDNRLFIHTPAGRRGLFSIFPDEPAPFTGLRLAPADADLFIETRLDLAALVKVAVAAAGQFMTDADALKEIDDGLEGLEEPFRSMVQFRGTLVALARIKPTNSDAETNALPFDYFIRLDTLGAVLRALFEKDESLQPSSHGALSVFTLSDGVLFAIDGDQVFAASSLAFLDECRTRKHGLDASPEVKALLADTAARGHSLTYATPRLYGELRKSTNLLSFLSQDPLGMISANDRLAFMQAFAALPEARIPMASVLVARPDGLLVRERSAQSSKAALPIVAAFTPDFIGEFALYGARAFAAFTSSSRAAELARKQLEPDLQRIAGAAQRYFAAHDDAESVSLSALRDEPDGAALPDLSASIDGDPEIQRLSDVITVQHREHGEIRHVIPLTDAQRQQIGINLRTIDAAAAHYFVRENTSSASFSSLFDSDSPVRPASIVGEDYESLSLDETADTFSITTPGEQEVSIPHDTTLVTKARRTVAEQRYAIEQNLARLDAAALALLETHTDEGAVDTAMLVARDAIGELTPVAGESYDDLYFTASSHQQSVESPQAGTVTYVRPLNPKTADLIRARLTELAGLTTAYFKENPDAVLVLAAELLPAEKLVLREPSENSDWEGDVISINPALSTLVIRRDATKIAVTTESGYAIEAPIPGR